MRRMNYDRFAKPYNFGEYDVDNHQFVLDKTIENGIYLIVVEDVVNNSTASSILTHKENFTNQSGLMYEAENGQAFLLEEGADNKHLVSLDIDGGIDALANHSIVYLYKID